MDGGEEVNVFKEIVCSSWIPFISLQQSFNFVVLEMELIMTVWIRLASSLWGRTKQRLLVLTKVAGTLTNHSETLYHPHEIKNGMACTNHIFRSMIWLSKLFILFSFLINPLRGQKTLNTIWFPSLYHLLGSCNCILFPSGQHSGQEPLVGHLCSQRRVCYVDQCWVRISCISVDIAFLWTGSHLDLILSFNPQFVHFCPKAELNMFT